MIAAQLRSAFVILLAFTLMSATGCASRRGVDFAGIAEQSTATLSDITSLENRISESDYTDEGKSELVQRTTRLRAMTLGIDIALIAAAGRQYDQQRSQQINAAAEIAHRHLQSFINRPADLFARSALTASEWSAFESRADALLMSLQERIEQ
ncbi:MAG: hypothetical protein AAF937_03630 [Planctomycetota bacterium]